MRNKYNQHQQLQQEHEQQHHHHQRSKFLPMLCSSSTKQVIKLSHRRTASTSSSSSSTVSDEPLSPRVGCMGQVKRNNKVVGFPSMSFVSGFTTSNTTSPCNNIKSDQISSNYSSNSIVKYHNLIRFFSTKSLSSSPKTVIAAAAAVPRNGTHQGKIIAGRSTKNSNSSSNSVRSRGTRLNTRSVRDDHGIMISRSKNEGNCGGNNNENDKGCLVNLVELDPPLPVVKQKQQQQENDNGDNTSLWKRRSGGVPLKGLQLQVTQQSCALLLQSTTV